MKLNIIDIFSGAGGFSKGFEQAGFNVKYGFDFDQDAINTFNFNHGKTAEGMVADLSSKEELKKILTLLSKTSVDGIIGGPPCQGFSLAGPRRENDPRNKLYFSMIEIAKEASPQFVLIENVPSLATLYGGEALKNIYADLRKIGYYATHTVLKASDFSIPQIRRRLFIVAFKNKQNLEKFKFPEKSNKQVTVRDAISDLPILGEVHTDGIFKYLNEACTTYQKKMRKNSTMIFNHQNSKHTDTTIKMLKLIESGKNAKSLPPKYRAKYTYNDALTRMDWNKPSRTIDTGHRTLFHPSEPRVPSVRECARIQSFPDSFIFQGSKVKQYRQVGNAVPPLLAERIAKSIKEVFND